MARPAPGIGRGLGAILSVSQDAGVSDDLRELPLELIVPNPRQPRQRFAEEPLAALADSVRSRGVLQPVLVRPRADGTYELIAGERRWRAAQLAGLELLPALVREHGDAASLELALIENMAREDLSPIEEARACAALVEELGMTREEVGRRVGRSRVAVANLMRLLDLPDEAIELIQSGLLSEGHGRAVLLAEDHDARRRLAAAAAQGGWSVRATEDRAREANASPLPGEGTSLRVARSREHPDVEDARREIGDALSAAIGAEVRVRARRDGGYSAELRFESAGDALELAELLGAARTPG